MKVMLVELRHISGDRLINRLDLETLLTGRWLLLKQSRFL